MNHNGLSGCKLEILNNGVLRKYSSSDEYNHRLLKQIDKQILFSKLILKNINTPKIINVNYDDIISFDMEYIPGYSSYDYFCTANIDEINFVIQTLFNYFDNFIINIKHTSINNKLLDKLDLLKTKTNHYDYISYLKTYINKNDLIIPKTFCHGDLTFNNIIFHKNRLFFIDFLDSYVDSFLCDLVKLKQDLFYFWNLKIENKNNLRMVQIYKFIWYKLYDRYREYIDTNSFEILDVINILRIEPYLTNAIQKSIIDTIITSTKIYEKFNSSYGGKV